MSEHQILPLTPLSFQILVALADASRHGYGIIKEIEEAQGRAFKSSTGTLYLAIQRLVKEGLIEEEPAPPPGGDPRRKYYRLTPRGRGTAVAEVDRLAQLLGVARKKRLVRKGSPEAPLGA